MPLEGVVNSFLEHLIYLDTLKMARNETHVKKI